MHILHNEEISIVRLLNYCNLTPSQLLYSQGKKFYLYIKAELYITATVQYRVKRQPCQKANMELNRVVEIWKSALLTSLLLTRDRGVWNELYVPIKVATYMGRIRLAQTIKTASLGPFESAKDQPSSEGQVDVLLANFTVDHSQCKSVVDRKVSIILITLKFYLIILFFFLFIFLTH